LFLWREVSSDRLRVRLERHNAVHNVADELAYFFNTICVCHKQVFSRQLLVWVHHFGLHWVMMEITIFQISPAHISRRHVTIGPKWRLSPFSFRRWLFGRTAALLQTNIDAVLSIWKNYFDFISIDRLWLRSFTPFSCAIVVRVCNMLFFWKGSLSLLVFFF